MRSFLLRSSSLAIVLGAALSAHASYVYKFAGGGTGDPDQASFTLTSTSLISSDTVLSPASVDTYHLGHVFDGYQLKDISILPNSTLGGDGVTRRDLILVHADYQLPNESGESFYFWYFPLGSFASVGDHVTAWHDATLSVQPVPEPSMMAVLGLGAVGLLKRRRKS